ncbi:MAG: hypothetical protein WA970_20335 [Gammaproteobacteria bacterium]|nr:hypothetical protein [Gammaproteobacteria bacterium]
MNTTKARGLFDAYAQIQAKLIIMQREAELKNTALQEARRKLNEALGRLEIAVSGLPGLTKQGKPSSTDGVRLDQGKLHDV